MVSVVGLGLMILLMVVVCVLLIGIKCQTRKEHRAGPGLDSGHDATAAISVYGHDITINQPKVVVVVVEVLKQQVTKQKVSISSHGTNSENSKIIFQITKISLSYSSV